MDRRGATIIAGHIWCDLWNSEGLPEIGSLPHDGPVTLLRRCNIAMRSPLLIFLLIASFILPGGCARRKRSLNAGASPQQTEKSPTQRTLGRDTSEIKILRGRIIGITDGDTVELLDNQEQSYKIRLKGIDAPEKRQPFGDVSRKHLAGMLAGKDVTVEWQKHDRYGRIVGRVVLDGIDVCLEQIKSGMAWHYKYFENEQTDIERVTYAGAELDARSKKLGLWQDLSPVPPWAFKSRPS